MRIYEVGKKYKSIATVVKLHKEVPSVILIDDRRYVLETIRPAGKGGKDGSRKPRNDIRKFD